ncbi:hypothetical protein [Streptomyces sp. NPDC051109]
MPPGERFHASFDIAVDHVFVQGGREVERETMKTRNAPRDGITCGCGDA